MEKKYPIEEIDLNEILIHNFFGYKPYDAYAL